MTRHVSVYGNISKRFTSSARKIKKPTLENRVQTASSGIAARGTGSAKSAKQSLMILKLPWVGRLIK